MDAHRWHLVEQVLDRALGCDPEDWPALLDEACRGDPALREEVDALLSRRPDAERFLATPPAAAASALVEEVRKHASATGEQQASP